MSADEARDKAYPNNPFAYNGPLNFKKFHHIARPVTERVLSQSIVLIKALIREYGMPTTIQFSTSYSMGAPRAIRKKYQKTMAAYEKSIQPFLVYASKTLQRNLIYIELPEAITLKSTTSSDSIEVDHGYFLRGKVRSKSGTFEISTLDKQYMRTSIPFFSLSKLYKCEVDPLGTIRKITKPEKRMEFHLK